MKSNIGDIDPESYQYSELSIIRGFVEWVARGGRHGGERAEPAQCVYICAPAGVGPRTADACVDRACQGL